MTSYGENVGLSRHKPFFPPFSGPDETILLPHETILGSRRNHPETVAGPFC
jgi:hypothetical protein